MSESKKSIAIITGASSGIGTEFVKQLASDPSVNEFWLIARRKNRLEDLAQQIFGSNCQSGASSLAQSQSQSQTSTPSPMVRILSLDLTNSADLQKLQDLLTEAKPHIRWLINNAGFGLVGNFENLDLSKQLEMIDLNVKALTFITSVCLPYLNKGDHIIMTASTAGFFPLPQFAVYAATKAFVVSFANALSSELRPKGIQVMALCPGPVATEFFNLAYSNEKFTQRLPTAQAPEVVKKALKDARKGAMRSTYGLAYELLVDFSGIIPRRSLLWRPVQKALAKLPH